MMSESNQQTDMSPETQAKYIEAYNLTAQKLRQDALDQFRDSSEWGVDGFSLAYQSLQFAAISLMVEEGLNAGLDENQAKVRVVREIGSRIASIVNGLTIGKRDTDNEATH